MAAIEFKSAIPWAQPGAFQVGLRIDFHHGTYTSKHNGTSVGLSSGVTFRCFRQHRKGLL